ncbi:Hypothetical protein A7982_03768 [Minicystis rosea]|nr:Hypothetical protein A7982_03768 [Minicystis rosea]
MTKLTAALHALFLVAATSFLAACGRSEVDISVGGSSATSCQTNADCASTPATPLCLIPPGQCVACLTSPDTCPAGETCDAQTHTCVPTTTGCQSDADCSAPTPHCRLDTHVCVECTSNEQCPGDEQCASFQCVGFCGDGSACTNGKTCCSPLCVDASSDPENCGGCGIKCGPFPQASGSCSGATCTVGQCFPGFANCNGLLSDGCEVDTATDATNCGGCGITCKPDETCSGGTCAGSCGAVGSCTPTQTCCGTQCANTQSDPLNCGTCGNTCTAVPQGNTACVSSACQIINCAAGFADCNGKIIDGCEAATDKDPNNCGTCGTVCAAGSVCVAGTCQSTTCKTTGCPVGLACCGVACTDTNNDLGNCGGCGNACPPNATACMGGGCCFPQPGGGVICSSVVCTPPLQNCGGTCVDQGTDPSNCGGCGIKCGPTETCVNGTCTGTITCNGGPACAPTQACCASGCASTDTDPKNCGKCGIVCPAGNNCVGGSCQATCNGGPTCSPTQQCCSTGCANTGSDPNNCGGCGIVCPADTTCVNGACQGTCNGGPMCGAGQTCCPSGCANTTSDVKNCGGCGIVCGDEQTCNNGMCTTPMQCNGGPACGAGQTCCPTGCADLNNDPNHCGGCATVCGPTASCINGSCATNEGAFNPIVNPTFLAPGVHNFTTINIPAGVTVFVAGPGPASGTLDLRATGAIVIDGTIDLSGGPGTQNTITSMSTQSGRAGSGGYTGEPYQSATPSSACQFIAGNPGQLGFQLQGTPGTCTILSTSICVSQMDPAALVFTAPPAMFGGGAGVFTGFRGYGSGGGGPAGGAPGAIGPAFGGQQNCSGASGGGGAVAGKGGNAGNATYNGKDGVLGQTQCQGVMGFPPAYVGGGGGGSIGTQAALDRAVLTTFQTGSGGGGGSADYLNRPVFGGTSGGGGGGGALKLSTPASITIKGQLLANGGVGGDAFIGNGAAAGCDPQPGAAGGGGSGGVIYLSAPSVSVSNGAVISAAGGAGGFGSLFASGGGGGAGGLGRIRLSVSPATCSLSGTFKPPLQAGCGTANAAGFAYVGTYPN